MTVEPTLAQQQAAGLRALADMIEQNPDLPEARLDFLFVFHPNTPTEHAELARAALRHGGKVDKQVSDEMYNLVLRWGPVGAGALAYREQVCERVVTGTRQVTKTVPDPERLAQVPTVEVTETVEQVEWRCTPLLAAEQAGEA